MIDYNRLFTTDFIFIFEQNQIKMKLYSELENLLKTEPNYITDDKELKKWVVINKAQNYDQELLSLLLENEEIKAKFFISIKNTLVFNQALFIQFLEQKNYLKDSYTSFRNKIGLTIDGKFLNQRNEVALVWPYKDCILEGGQSREEDKRKEIFFNEVLAQDEINQLLEPKVLTNAKRYSVDGEMILDTFNRNSEGTITDNLIIKGNNLLALHTLKEEFAGKVKLIYIDPPYNRKRLKSSKSDEFNYNDKFNHSTWLTFMKNRLSQAKELLSIDGAIFISCDNAELAYLQVLCEEIFHESNFVTNIIWKKGKEGGNDSPFMGIHHDYITFFVKDSNSFKINLEEKDISRHKLELSEQNLVKGIEFEYGSGKLFQLINLSKQKDYNYNIELINGEVINWDGFLSNKTFEKYVKEGRIFIGKNKVPYVKSFLEDEIEGSKPSSVFEEKLMTTKGGGSENKKLFGNKNFSYPKPERLIERIISISTNENDLVLDYHLGSGTTAAVAHKMNRQYIGVEQMDYIENVAVERIKKVIEGEQGGISKSVNWNGGGEFVYLELKKHNQNFIDQIENAKDTKAILKIWEEMKAKSFLNYNVDIKKQDEHIVEFKKLTQEEQKLHLVSILDKNQLYVNQSSLNDKDCNLTEEEVKITKDFYQL